MSLMTLVDLVLDYVFTYIQSENSELSHSDSLECLC